MRRTPAEKVVQPRKPVEPPSRNPSQARVGVDGGDGPVHIALVSLREDTGRRRKDALEAAVTRVFGGSAIANRLLLLPGVGRAWPDDENVVAGISAGAGAWSLFECLSEGSADYRATDAQGHLLSTRVHQRFAESGDVDAEPDLVSDLLGASAAGGERLLHLAGLRVGLLVCGENNVLRNEQSHANRVSVRHFPGRALFPDAEIVFNGAHTNMGNWGKLDKRFEFLSQDGRLALFATNNDAGSWRGSLRVWHDGVKVADGAEVHDQRLSARVIHDDDDRFAAVSMVWMRQASPTAR